MSLKSSSIALFVSCFRSSEQYISTSSWLSIWSRQGNPCLKISSLNPKALITPSDIGFSSIGGGSPTA